ncbi:MAG: hypothetical protein IJP63_01735 [Acholeplasmatales bacterium]|nr:hypothetical protein [Acholeplasmatales bacterium]
MKNVKQMIKKLSDTQDIHDVSNDVLKNVDMNKVRNQVIVKTPEPKRIILFSNLISAFAAAMLVVLVVVLVNSNSKPENNNPIDNPIVDNNTGDNNTALPEANFEDNLLMFSQYLESMQNQEAYNMINVVPSFGKFTFNEVTLSDDKKMTDSEMEALASDLNSQIYNIEEMLGLTSVQCKIEENQAYGIDESKYKDYENVITVDGPLSSYKLYFNEKNITEKNVGKTNFKSKSNIYGVIDSINSLVSFEGHKEYKNGETTYSTLIELEGYTIEVIEVFGKDANEFTYNVYKDSELAKQIYVKQKLDDDRNVRALEFKNQYTTINVEKKNVSGDSKVTFKVDSRNGETLTVHKTETNYTYKFGNGKEIVYNK